MLEKGEIYITYRKLEEILGEEILQKYWDKIMELPARCDNCSHRDTLGKFFKIEDNNSSGWKYKLDNDWLRYHTYWYSTSTETNVWDTSTYPGNFYTDIKTTPITGTSWSWPLKKKIFECPKCHSSLITIKEAQLLAFKL